MKALQEKLAYVKRVAVEALPTHLREQTIDAEFVFAVHGSDGAPLALAYDLETAKEFARDREISIRRLS